jgi:exodeoxyribonuclease VII large subunit
MAEAARAGAHVYSVAELLGGLGALFEERVGRVWLAGEVSNLHRAPSGHLYFTLKDDTAQIRAALFRGAARSLAFEPEDGLEVLVYGDVRIYESRGDLQIIVRQLEPRGEGALQLAFEQLRRRLEAEGLFDPARKRPIPAIPSRVGVVTSPTSAAIRDVLEVSGRRAPALPILIAPTRVQGEGAEREIADALDRLGAREGIDVILLVRGGGSLEDLRAFNSETVARAIVRCPVPVVSGVGHEVDFTIADFAADLRAPTPSVAAERVAPDRMAIAQLLLRDWGRLKRAAVAVLDGLARRLQREGDAIALLVPSARIAAQGAQLAALARALERAVEARLEGAVARLTERAAQLDALSPLAVLSRGYALVRRVRDGAIVRSADQLAPGERLRVRVAEAEIDATVEAVRALARN